MPKTLEFLIPVRDDVRKIRLIDHGGPRIAKDMVRGVSCIEYFPDGLRDAELVERVAYRAYMLS